NPSATSLSLILAEVKSMLRTNPEPLVDADVRLVAEVGLAALLGPARARLLGMCRTHACRTRRRRVLGCNQRGIEHGALLENEPLHLQLPIDLGKGSLHNADRHRRLAEAPDGGLVRRAFFQTEAAEAAERQPIGKRLLHLLVAEVVGRLKIE